MNPYLDDGDQRLYHGDCTTIMPRLGPVDAIITDPPYGLGFMGKDWDSPGGTGDFPMRRTTEANTVNTGVTRQGGRQRSCSDFARRQARDARNFQDWCESWAVVAFEALKPGGHIVAFGGTRTYHRLACALEDAGFEIRDCLSYLYGSGFPKSLNVGCRCDSEPSPEHGLRSMRGADLPSTEHAADECGEVLFSSLPEPRLSPDGSARPEPSAAGRAEPRMEGRRDVVAEARQLSVDQVRPCADVGTPDGSDGRLRDGASPDLGADGWASADADRGRASSQSRPARQPRRQPRTVADESGSQASGSWPFCPRCGMPVAGLGTALKPAWEPIILARKPLVGTVAGNVLEHGTGALNIDACRIGEDKDWPVSRAYSSGKMALSGNREHGANPVTQDAGDPSGGRWPANVVLDESAAAMLDEQAGERVSGANPTRRGSDKFRTAYGDFEGQRDIEPNRGAERGGASRFFYTAKASRSERNNGIHDLPLKDGRTIEGGHIVSDGRTADKRRGPSMNHHPTVKPVALMRWLVRLTTPPGGLVLDPFVGSGSTLVACRAENVRGIGIDRELDYLRIAAGRLSQQSLFG